MTRLPVLDDLSLDRRQVVVAAAAGATLVPLGIGGVAIAQSTNDNSTPETTDLASCMLSPEMTEGPYYLDDMLVRQDITDGKEGVPLALTMTVLDTTTCAPLENAAVEIWHCDAKGFYSGFVENNPDGQSSNAGYVDDGSDEDSFLRGIQLTDADGVVTFQTIYPGWYSGRDVHIHLMVHVGGETEDGTYDGGTVAHSGQIAFADEMTDQIAEIEPYASRVTTHVLIEDDMVFADHLDEANIFLTMTQVETSDLAAGLTGTITLGVDSTATSSDR